MSLQNRRSSLVNIDEWLDRCPGDEPDSMIYEPDYCNEIAIIRTRQREPDIESLYRVVTDMCTKIGLPPNLVEDRLNDIDECLTTFLNTIQQDIQEEYDKLCQYKQDLLNQVDKMMKDLYLPEYVPDENITLLQHCKRLKTKFSDLNIVKQNRMTRLQELRDKQTRHCLILGIKTPQFKSKTDIPTEEELKSLAATVLEMEKEEARRKAKYMKLRSDIEKLMDELEYKPENGFEETVSSDKPNYSESYLLQMSNLYDKLQLKHAKNLEKFQMLSEKLMSLYERMDTPQEERDLFLSSHKICSPTSMLEMEVEIEHYEKLKKQNIGKFVEKIKDELIIEYERCFLSQQEQDNFFSLFTISGEYSEELLELCERELDRIKRYYQENKEILDRFHKWRLMWKELIDIELKSNDPSRFTNRGGQLLLEEKKRKTLQKGLPKIEKELTVLNDKYAKSSENNVKFKVFGTNLDEFIAGCWDELNNAKEEEKKERQRAKMKSAPPQRVPLVKKTPIKRPLGAGITPTPVKSTTSSLPRPVKSSTSALSMSEQEFEDMIVGCPASAKKGR